MLGTYKKINKKVVNNIRYARNIQKGKINQKRVVKNVSYVTTRAIDSRLGSVNIRTRGFGDRAGNWVRHILIEWNEISKKLSLSIAPTSSTSSS